MFLFLVFHPTGPLADEAAVFQLRPMYQHAARQDAGRSLGHPGAAENGPPDTICILDLLLELRLPTTRSSHTVSRPQLFICVLTAALGLRRLPPPAGCVTAEGASGSSQAVPLGFQLIVDRASRLYAVI